MKKAAIVMMFLLVRLAVSGQSQCSVSYYNEDDGLPQGHVTQLLQDADGFMWFSTWNGLCRFDGYEFRQFKPRVGDGCHMRTDRIRNICLTDNGNIYCRVDDDYFLFNTRTYRFCDLSADEAARAKEQMNTHRLSTAMIGRQTYDYTDNFGTTWTVDAGGMLSRRAGGEQVPCEVSPALTAIRFCCPDRQGNLWLLGTDGIYKLSFYRQQATPLFSAPAQVKSLFVDRQLRYWVTTKEDAAVRIWNSDNTFAGFLGADGRLRTTFTSFDSPIYCICQQADGTLWLGSKPDGLFRLRPASTGYSVEHFRLPDNNNVYNIKPDDDGRLWIATLGGGVYCCADATADEPRFVRPAGCPKDLCLRARFIHISHGTLLVATTEGLVTATLATDVDRINFRVHQKDPDREQSLSSSATMDVLEMPGGRYFVSTESGGVNLLSANDMAKETLNFRHFDMTNRRIPTDVALALANDDGQLLVVSSSLLYTLDRKGNTTVMDTRFFHASYRFSDARPVKLKDGQWLFGLQNGAIKMSKAQMKARPYQPRIVLTAADIQNSREELAIEDEDSLVLKSHERNLIVRFAALDYSAPERIDYFFRLVKQGETDEQPLTHLGKSHSVTLIDLQPGSYELQLYSTNADGQWCNNVRRLVIVVTPTFWETTTAKALIVLLLIGFVAAVAYTLLYIRRIRRQQHETLEAYLALLNKEAPTAEAPAPAAPRINPEDDAMMQRVMAFIEQNIGNSDVGIGDMAAAAATSRSGLQRKLKHTIGITPLDLLREARIKHACQLLKTTDKTIAEVAYASGFSDPKYFSRCFKQTMGQSPSDYKETM